MPRRHKNILLIGLGGVGYHLAKRLAHEDHAITVIESDPELIRRADGEIDARLIRGNAMCFSCWADAVKDRPDYLIAVTDNDAVNIVSSLIGDRLGIPSKISRVRSMELWSEDAILTKEDLKLDLIIRPEELVAQEIARIIEMRAGNDVIDIAEGHMQVLASRIGSDSPLAHRSLKEISQRFKEITFRIVAIARSINTIIPTGDDKLVPRDHVFFLARNEELGRLMELADVSAERRHRVMIVGGGLVGSRVAQLLEEDHPVRIVEHDARRAEELTYQLERTEVLHGDGADTDTLIQAGLLDMDTVITATGDNETNIMTSVLAKHVIRNQPGDSHGKVGKTIALVGREEYLVLAASMGSDIVLNKKVLAANEILKYIRREKLLSVAHMHGVDADVVEVIADEGAPVTRRALFELADLMEEIIIGGVFKDGKWEIAVGSTHIQPGDRVIAVCSSRRMKSLHRLFDA